jgi:hypothetical protein
MASAAKKKPAVDPETGDLPTLLMKWKHPDYAAIIRTRLQNLDRVQEHPEDLPLLKAYYKANPADFINDWGWTYDPRNADIGLPTLIPFILFQRQREWIDWVMACWRARRPGLCEKSRDMGVSWEAMGLSCTLGIHYDGIAIGVGSRKTEYVDKIGTHKPLLPKGRVFMENLPVEFRGGWEAWRDAPFMRITIPATGSIIAGEGGDDLGRGDRTTLYFVDEYAHFERPELTEASLSMTTNCRIDMSSVRGMNNTFARKRWAGKVDVFIFDWHQDPRKDQAWYDKQVADLDPVVVAQEIDRDYQASVTGVVIPGPWAKACVGALEALGLVPTGDSWAALDIADEGVDMNAFIGGHGVQIDVIEEKSGKGSDIFQTVEWAFELCDEHGYTTLRYDADGLGAGVRGDAAVINARRVANKQRPITVIAFRGSGEVIDPDGQVFEKRANDQLGRTNKDYFQNHKSQGWWTLRRRAQNTHRWRVDKKPCNPDEILSINPKCALALKLVAEMSQPTYAQSGTGKMLINKKPDGMKSPNWGDGAMIKYAPIAAPPLVITQETLAKLAAAMPRGGQRRR